MLIEIWRKNKYYSSRLFLNKIKTNFLNQIKYFKTIVNTTFHGGNNKMK